MKGFLKINTCFNSLACIHRLNSSPMPNCRAGCNKRSGLIKLLYVLKKQGELLYQTLIKVASNEEKKVVKSTPSLNN